MSVVHQPVAAHACHVNWEERPLASDHPTRRDGFTTYLVPVGDWDPPGTVRACECGRTWVAFKDPPGSGYLATRWRREGRFERWQRERKMGRLP